MKSIKNILVTTDFTEDSQWAIEEAAMLAEKFHSTLYMLDVVKEIPESGADYVVPYGILRGTKERLMKEASKKIKRKVAEMERKFRIKAVADVRYGNVYDEIMKEEDEKHIDLVVIAPHIKNRFTEKLFSHLAERVAKNSQCDTLIVRSDLIYDKKHYFV